MSTTDLLVQLQLTINQSALKMKIERLYKRTRVICLGLKFMVNTPKLQTISSEESSTKLLHFDCMVR